jgi:transcriptional regulator with XRE-family HTH domain
MGTTQSVVGRLEAGGSRPTIVTLERVARALGLHLEVRFNDGQRPAKAALETGPHDRCCWPAPSGRLLPPPPYTAASSDLRVAASAGERLTEVLARECEGRHIRVLNSNIGFRRLEGASAQGTFAGALHPDPAA